MDKYNGFEGLHEFEKEGDSKSRILNAAIYMFSKEGYIKATTKGIAELAQVSEALLFKYYGNKQKLLGAVSMEIVEVRLPNLFEFRLDEIFKNAYNFSTGQFTSIIKDKFQYISGNTGYFKILFMDMDYNESETIVLLRGKINEFFSKIEKYLMILQKVGVVRKDLPPRTIMRSFSGNMAFLLLDLNVMKSPLDIERELELIVEIFLEGVGKHE